MPVDLPILTRQILWGATCLKQALIDLTLNTAVLREPVTDDNFVAATRRV